MSANTVEVSIGTRFGAEDHYFGDLTLAGRAAWNAGNIAQRSVDNRLNPNLDQDYPASMKNSIAFDCANIIISLAKISMHRCGKQPPSSFNVNLGYFEGIEESSMALVHSVARILQLVDSGASTPALTLQDELWNAIRLACMIAAIAGETDLEHYILACLR